jgi:hypothetical protein
MQHPINELITKLLKHSAPAHELYENGEKKSLFMINPAAKKVYYVDKLHRPLLQFELDLIKQQLPQGFEVIDISRLESAKHIYSPGFHSSQPMIHELDKWLAHAEQKIQSYSKTDVVQVKEQVVEKIQIAPAPHTFFAKSAHMPSGDTASKPGPAIPPQSQKPREPRGQ